MTRIVDQGPGMDRTGIALPQGPTLGGSTAINGMVCPAGNRRIATNGRRWAIRDGPSRTCSAASSAPSANICAATMMVAEKGVDMLLAGGR